MRVPLFLIILLATLAGPVAALAHHGLTMWDETKIWKVDGFISHELTGFPHWEIKVRDADGNDWRIDLGNGFEMERAGMNKDGSGLGIGTKVHVEGVRPRDSDTRLIRPSKIIAGDKEFDFKDKWN